ncbi:MAG: hypothetical protein ABS44_05360 [Chryseobacterium sp. SCN 40-13]|nr:MAG: hypothetical protein ABS44_05360 [Chryseobacterium sp. SCN 40-13]
MKTEIAALPLVSTLEHLTIHPKEFNEVIADLFGYNYEDYNALFEIDKISLDKDTHVRIPVFSNEECTVFLRIWGPDNATAIHDHYHWKGKIKVLKGLLTEISYRENSNFIEYNGATSAPANMIFQENHPGIHSIVNNDIGITVSLHIYKSPEFNLKGIRIFDTELRRIAWLNEKAASCSWNLPEECYDKIICN